MRSARKESIACHEAGHVVAYCTLTGRAPTRATIESSIGQLGRVDYTRLSSKKHFGINISDKARLRAEQSIMIKLAGPIAEKKCLARPLRNYHNSADWLGAIDLAFRLAGSERAVMPYLGWLEYKTADLIKHRWQTVKCVAGALLRQETLSRAELQKILMLAGLLLLVHLIPIRACVRTEVSSRFAQISLCSSVMRSNGDYRLA